MLLELTECEEPKMHFRLCEASAPLFVLSGNAVSACSNAVSVCSYAGSACSYAGSAKLQYAV